nr:unnamed protein product [Spirometra erinaceieuropaei]
MACQHLSVHYQSLVFANFFLHGCLLTYLTPQLFHLLYNTPALYFIFGLSSHRPITGGGDNPTTHSVAFISSRRWGTHHSLQEEEASLNKQPDLYFRLHKLAGAAAGERAQLQSESARRPITGGGDNPTTHSVAFISSRRWGTHSLQEEASLNKQPDLYFRLHKLGGAAAEP